MNKTSKKKTEKTFFTHRFHQIRTIFENNLKMAA